MGRIIISAILFAAFFWYALNLFSEDTENKTRIMMEYAYFQGQKDALEGKLNIEYDSLHEDWFWVRNANPWKDGTQPTYNPQKPPIENL